LQLFLGALLGTVVTAEILALFVSDLSSLALYILGLFVGFSPAFIKTYWRLLALVGVLLVVGVTGFQLYDEYGRGESVGSGDGDSGSSNQGSGTKGENSGEEPPPPPSSPPPLSSEPKEIILQGIPFEFNAQQILPEFLAVLNETVRILQEKPDVSVLIEGHTDAVGSGRANLSLSKKRAEAVRNYLMGQGIAAERLHVVGRGESDPLAPNTKTDGSDDPDGRAINRRVELSVE
jgi:outer membrane protein OmpA-like peptidoglycan-associated protein